MGIIFKEDVYLTEKTEGEWNVYIETPDKISAPVKKGEVVGRAVATHQNGKKIYYDVIAEKDIFEKKSEEDKSLMKSVFKVYKQWLLFFSM